MILWHASRIVSFSWQLAPTRRVSLEPLRMISSLVTSHSQYTKIVFDLQLPEGRCVGLELTDDDEDIALEGWSDASHWVHECLHPDEVLYGQQQKPAVRKSFLLGRLAIRAALGNEQPCLKDKHGRPTLPSSHLGSISHKGKLGVALIAPSFPMTGIGVDIERQDTNRRSVAPKVLTKREIQSLGRLENISADQEVLLRFSLKEAIYKAAHPLINHYVGFQEAEVTPWEDGTATCVWKLESGADPKFSTLTAHWRKHDNYFLTSAHCTLSPSDNKTLL